MSKVLELKLAVLEKCAYAIDRELISSITKQLEKDAMLVAACVDANEKDELVKSELKKMQRKLLKASPDIAALIQEYMLPGELENIEDGYDGLRVQLIISFVRSELKDLADFFESTNFFSSKEEVLAKEDWFWDSIICNGEYGVDAFFMKHFVKFMTLAFRIKNYRDSYSKTKTSKQIFDNPNYLNLKEIQENEKTSLELYKYVKKQTQLDLVSLSYFKQDIEMFLFFEKEEMSHNATTGQIVEALKELREVRGYTDEDFFKFGIYRKPLIGDEKMKSSIHIDREKLLYPFEFDQIYGLLDIVNEEIEKQGGVSSSEKTLKLKTSKGNSSTIVKNKFIDFDALFSDDKKKQYVIGMLEDLSITINGKSILSQRKKSVIRGVVEALREACIVPHRNIHSLCLIIGEQIGLEIRSKLEKNYTAEESYKSVIEYMKNNPLH